MKPLFVLLAVFAISAGLIRYTSGHYDWQIAGRIGMAAMLAFTAIGHFAFTQGMAMMLPPGVPAKDLVVKVTGIIEIAAAIGLLLPSTSSVTGWLLIVLFILLLPANVYAAVRRVDYQKATYAGPGTAYLWFRVPLQVLFVGWVYWAALY